MPRKLSTEEFIKRSSELHNNKYTYDKCVYIDSLTVCTITCPEHGDFELRTAMHLQGKGCQKCSPPGAPFSTTEKFVKKAKKVHNNHYIYDKVQYTSSNEKVIITCKIHGDFPQRASMHLEGNGCPKCANDYVTSLTRHSTERFIEDARKVHGDRYDYSLVQYKGWNDKVKIICRTHGIFLQTPHSHKSGSNCNKCMMDKRRSSK